MSLKVTQNKSGFGEHVVYRTIINDAAGIFPKTPIKVAGINAGRIKKIDLVGSQALIEFEVKKDIPVTSQSILRIKSVGFLGDKYLDIVLGDPNADRLGANGMIPSKTGGGLEDLTKDASEIMTDLKAVIRSIRESVAPEGQKPLVEIIQNIRETSKYVKEVTKSLKHVVSDNEHKLHAIVDNMENLSESLAYEANSTKPDSLMFNLKKVGPVLDNLRDTMADAKVIVADMRAGKGTVGKLLRDEEIVDQVSETLSGVNRIVNQVNNLRTELDLNTAYNTELGNVSRFNLDLAPTPERFYRLGLVTSEIGPTREKEITTTQGSSTQTITRKEVDKNTYRFNIQLGRIVQNWAFRVGIIESSGGLGIDYYLKNRRTRFTFEVFDYREDLGPNVRMIGHFHFWNVFYGRIAVEDLVSKADEQSLTLGAGMRFTDEDLRGIVGFFL